MRRWFTRLLLALLLAVLLPALTLLGVLGSERGTRWLLTEALSRTADQWSLGATRGDLLSSLQIEKLEWRAGETELAIRKARLDWRPASLLAGLLHIEQLRLVGAHLVTPPATDEQPAADEPDQGPPSLPELPVRVRIDSVYVEDVLSTSGDSEFRLDSAELATRIDGTRVLLQTLTARTPQWQVSAKGEVDGVAPFPFSAEVTWQAEVPDLGTATGAAELSGDMQRFSVKHHLSAPFQSSLDAQVDVAGLASRADIKASWTAVLVPVGEDEWRSGAGSLSLQGGADDFELQVATDASGPGVALHAATLSVKGSVNPEPPYALNLAFAWDTAFGAEPAAIADAKLAGGGSIGGNLDRLRVDHALSSPFRLRTGADIGLVDNPVTLAVDGDWRGLRWPLTGDAEVDSESGDYQFSGDLAHLSFRLGAAVEAVAADVRNGRVDLDGSADLVSPFAFDARIQWRASLPEQIEAAGGGQFKGDINTIDLEHALTSPFSLSTRGRVQPASNDALLDIEGEWSGVRWPVSGETITVTSENGGYSARGGLERLLTSVHASVGGEAVPLADAGVEVEATLALVDGVAFDARLGWQGKLPEGVDVRAEGSARGDLENIDFEHHLTAPFAVDTSGNVQLAGDTPVLSVRGGWRALRWPLAGDTPEYESKSGSVSLDGTPEDYLLRLDAELDGIALPPVTATLQAAGSSTGADIHGLELRTLDGLARLAGRVDWSPKVVFDLAVDGSGINPGLEWSDWPGKLGFAVVARGSVEDSGPTVEVSGLRVDGQLRGYPLALSGDASVLGSAVSIPSLELRSGSNRLQLNGEVGDALDIDFELQAPDLAAFWPGLSGKADARGLVSGALTAPRVDISLEGRKIAFEENLVNSLELKAKVDVTAADASSVELVVADAVLGGQTIERIALSGNGGPQAHRATLTADTNIVDLALSVDGGWDGKRWKGRLASLELTPLDSGAWRTPQAAGIVVDAKTVRLDELCLGQDAASLCAALRKSADDKLDGRFKLTLPLAIAKPWLPPDMAVQGTIEAEGSVAGSVSAPRVNLRVAPPPGSLRWAAEGQPEVTLAWRDFLVEAALVDDRLQATAGLLLDDLGRIAANVQIGRADKGGDRALSGVIEANIDDLALVAAFSPQVVAPKGRIAVAVELGGSVARPSVRGEAGVHDASLQLPDIGLDISDIQFRARSRGDDLLVVEGGMRSGDGELKLDGEVSLDPARGYPATLAIKGESFEVAKLPIAHVFASPDLRLEHSAELTRILGTVSVPTARFRLRQIPVSATTVSDDEVVLQDAGKKPPTGALMDTDLTLLLGKDVSFSGFGLESRFEGRLQITAEPGQQPLGEGTIELRDATYKAYGQDLAVERGRLIFAGPMDNPGLDIRAVRTAGSVKAGLEVSGTASRPTARVFSEPSMPDAEAFSYLLTGRPLSGASQSEGSMLGSAALALGLENADTLTKKVGRELGLDEVGLGGDGEGAGLVLGKYLTPDIYVSYVMGLFDSSNSFKLDYRLSDRFSVQGQSGMQKQAVDLLYRYETN